jgi:hypothetical protein
VVSEVGSEVAGEVGGGGAATRALPAGRDGGTLVLLLLPWRTTHPLVRLSACPGAVAFRVLVEAGGG